MTDPDRPETVNGVPEEVFRGRGARMFKPGDIVGGRYLIEAFIGRGGMGLVYRATHQLMDRQVAIKILAPEQVDNECWHRFQKEGRAIAHLDHPNIVKVYDLGVGGPDCLYYVMDFLQGKSLAECIKEQKAGLPITETIAIFEQIAAALSYAHGKNLVHRDVKPTNIILCQTVDHKGPQVKIIDFGLVKLLGDASQIQQSQTTAGQVFGSPFYMSPEQCMSAPIDHRSDIYSLGCALFECLTGTPPFYGKSGLETASMHLRDEPPRLKDERPEKQFPEQLEELVARMLEKIPARRHQSMEQVAHELARIREGKSISRQPIFAESPMIKTDASREKALVESPRSRRRLFVWLSLFAVIALASILFVCQYFSAALVSEKDAKIIKGESKLPELITGQKETPDMIKAREIFANCPQISNGMITENGSAKTVFNFPSQSIGFISWGLDRRYKTRAAGEVIIPAGMPAHLDLERPESNYALMYPFVLEKIGSGDIGQLSILDTTTILDDSPLSFEVPVSLIHIIGKWKGLDYFQVQSCRLTDQAVLALNELPRLRWLDLRDCVMDGKTLARVTWLKNLRVLDVREMKNVDSVIEAISGSTNLRELHIDRTSPSKAALQMLAACPALKILSVAEADIDDDKLDALSQISSLSYLNLKRCMITGAGLPKLARLKNLKLMTLDLIGLQAAPVDKLRAMMPGCKISADNTEPGFKME